MLPRSIWGYRALLAGLLTLTLFFSLLPLGSFFGRIPGPDLMLALLIAWTLRRPDYVPLGLVALFAFMADALLMRPLGLGALTVVLATEYLRRSVIQTEALTFLDELLQAGLVIAACFFGERIILLLLFADQPPALDQILQVIVTFLFYPLTVGATQFVFGVRRLQPGEVDILGSRA